MTKPNITERKSCNMFQNNYTENSFLFKGLILKNLKIDEITETVIAQVEMPVKEHNCPHCGNITTYIKDYRILNCNKKLHTFKKSSCINLIKLILE